MNKSVKLVLTGMLTLILALAIYHGVVKSDFSKIKNVEIEGVQSKNLSRIQDLTSSVQGQNFWKLRLGELARPLQNDPWVGAVEISKVFPDKIKVKVKEREPLAIVNSGRGNFEYIDEEGHHFGPIDYSEISKNVVVSGKTLIENGHLKQTGIDLLKQLPETGKISKEDISELTYNNEKGFQLTLAGTGVVIDLGRENLTIHMERARKVVQYLEQHQIKAKHIDADYGKKVLVKVEKGR